MAPTAIAAMPARATSAVNSNVSSSQPARMSPIGSSQLPRRFKQVFSSPAPSSAPRTQRVVCQAAKGKGDGKDALTRVSALGNVHKLDEEAPFMEPLLRTLVLGLGAGALAEFLHVLTAAVSTASSTGIWALPSILPHAADKLTPLFLLDHVVAIGVWALLYLVEARTVSTILDAHPGQPDKAARTIRATMTLPKRMMPLSLTAAKRAVYKLVTGQSLAPAVSSAAATRVAAAPAPAPAPEADALKPPSAWEARATGAVLERPVTRSARPAPPSTPGSIPPLTIPDRIPSNLSDTISTDKLSTPIPDANVQNGSGLKPMVKPAGQPGETRRQREIRERKMYLKNFWYAAALSQDLKKGEVKQVKMLGRTVALFRDEDGTVKCIENLCPHRGAPLGKGWTKKVEGHNCVVCPYHGWAFDGEGRLKDVPSASDPGKLPKRPLIESYPIEEKGGFVWLFFGSKSMPAAERPPIPYVEEFDDPKWQSVYAEMEVDAPHWSVFDNALDIAHIHFVHNSSFGNADKPEIKDIHMERADFGLRGHVTIFNKPANPLWEFAKTPSVPVKIRAFLPMTSAVKIKLGAGLEMVTFVNTVPIDENRAVQRMAIIRNFAGWSGFDGFMRQEMFKILGEDKEIIEQLEPDSLRAEVSLGVDLPQVAFRKLRQEWIDMGYGVAPESTTGHKGSLNC